jgi:tetratricopeptide (TPR) repeat protein
MKTYHKFLLALLMMVIGAKAFSQTNVDAKSLVEQGVTLNDSGKYDEAIAKYNLAIKTDSNYANAYYELAYTLFSNGKEKEAIPYLEKVLALNPKSPDGCDMLGSIYDDLKQPDKAIDYYKQGLEADSTYQRLHFNLAITYYRIGKYPESESSAIKAIKLDPKHASSQRVYAMATYKLKKRAYSLMAWCSFLLLEPQSKRSPEAFAYVKNILNYGVTYKDAKSINISVNPNEGPGNLLMPMAIATALEKKKDLTAVDSVQFQLASLLEIAHAIADDKGPSFAANYYSDYFEKLAKSGNMPAFTHYISLSVYKEDDLKWFKEHDKELTDLDKWIVSTERKF